MSLTKSEIQKLRNIVAAAQKLIADAEKGGSSGKPGVKRGAKGPATRRSGKELEAFRAMLKAERKAGVSVAELAKKHSVTPSYIYQLER
jgi:hypothetical protein